MRVVSVCIATGLGKNENPNINPTGDAGGGPTESPLTQMGDMGGRSLLRSPGPEDVLAPLPPKRERGPEPSLPNSLSSCAWSTWKGRNIAHSDLISPFSCSQCQGACNLPDARHGLTHSSTLQTTDRVVAGTALINSASEVGTRLGRRFVMCADSMPLLL